MRLRREYGSYAKVVGALLARREGLVHRVGGDADDLSASQQLSGGAYICMHAGLSKNPDLLSILARMVMAVD